MYLCRMRHTSGTNSSDKTAKGKTLEEALGWIEKNLGLFYMLPSQRAKIENMNPGDKVKFKIGFWTVSVRRK